VKSTKGRLSIFFLPPYSPELNPDEWVWKSIKHDRVGRAIVRSVEELTDKIERAVDRLQATPELVRGFFRDRDLLYITSPVTELRSSRPVSA
jgi:transposase